MSQLILIDHIKVQNANAIGGFTWGFPAITHFLGFVHNLSRKLANEKSYQDITLSGCAVVAHEHRVHTYGQYERRFVQSRNPPYLPSHDKAATPPVIEEGKMNMTVSLLIGCDGNIGNRADGFRQWLKRACLVQRIAGGTILDIANVNFYTPENSRDVRLITRKLLPGFVLLDRSQYLDDHYQELVKDNPEVELLDAWLDFSALKQKARPKSDLISKYFQELIKKEEEGKLQVTQLVEHWHKHQEIPYEEGRIPVELKAYFAQLVDNKTNKNLLKQWQDYCQPTEKTGADWEYIKKPKPGYLVPIMIGYKAISQVYANSEVSNTRDKETDVCFVESVHSIGEWQSVHHLKTSEQLLECLWHYHYEKNWYLCKQGVEPQVDLYNQATHQNENFVEDIYS
jgi:CRISPR-associated protein Csy2